MRNEYIKSSPYGATDFSTVMVISTMLRLSYAYMEIHIGYTSDPCSETYTQGAFV